MKNKNILLIAFIGFGIIFTNTVFADTTVNLQIKTKDKIIYNNSILTKPCDSDNKGGMLETPYCAILQSGIPSVWDWSWAPGAFITSVDSIAGSTTKDNKGNDVYHYWSWSLNGSMAMDALNQYVLKEGDEILLEFIDPVEEVVPEVTKELIEAPVVHHSSGGYVSIVVVTPIVEKVFSIEKAYKFLTDNQKVDGSFGDPLYTDWATLAAVAGDNQTIKDRLIKYYKENVLESNLLTDNERRAMALMTLGVDPYTGTKVNYIKKIIESFDGTQFGDKNIENDDVFALIVLKNAGYNDKDEIIIKDVNYLISKQSKDGSYGSVDITAAAKEALAGLENIKRVNETISKIESYILSKQENDYGFGNSFTTSWVLQNFYEKEKILKSDIYLAIKQETDGGLEGKDIDINTCIWATSYAIPAVLHKQWGEILQKFPKQEFIIERGVKEEFVNKDLKTTKKESYNLNDNEAEINNLEIIQQDIVKKVSFRAKLSTFWVNTKHSFGWLLDKLSF